MVNVECLMQKERKTIMKTTKIYATGHWSLVLGIVMLLLADNAWAVDFKNSYRGMEQKTSATEYRMATTATAPAVGFQSTSAYSGQWNQDAQQSMLNADGTVNAEAYGVGANGPGMRKNSSVNPGTPDDDEEEEGEQQPLGDGLWILTLCALAYLIVRASRKRVY